MATVVFVHAHPDDEAIATGGTMAALAGAGHRVVLVTATGGELGEVPEGMLAPGEALADRRARELDVACEALGVARHELLGYYDSGMAGEASNERPDCFAKADVDEAARRLLDLLAGEQVDVLVAYDEHGGYGHPDHIQVHRVGMRAAELAKVPRCYMATMDRDALGALAVAWAEEAAAAPAGDPDASWSPPAEMTEGLEGLGEPGSRITTEVDVTAFVGAKRRAMRAHASQISETSFFLAMPDHVFELVWGREWYIRVRPAATDPHQGPREASLLV